MDWVKKLLNKFPRKSDKKKILASITHSNIYEYMKLIVYKNPFILHISTGD